MENGRAEYLHRLPSSFLNDLEAIMDFNDDGVLDLAFTAATGGNAIGAATVVVTWWDGEGYQDVDIGELKDVYDLEGDGRLEFETMSDWPKLIECGLDCDTAISGLRMIQYAPSMAWGWEAGGLVDISAKVPEFFKEVRIPALEKRRADMEAVGDECTTDDCDEAIACLLECLEAVEERARSLAGGD